MKRYRILLVALTLLITSIAVGYRSRYDGETPWKLLANGDVSIIDALLNIGDGTYAPDHAPASLYCEGIVEIDGVTHLDAELHAWDEVRWVDGETTYGQFRIQAEQEVVTIVATGTTADTVFEAPAGAVIKSVAWRVTQAPGGGPSHFNVGLAGGDVDAIADNFVVTVNGTGQVFIDGDATWTTPFNVGATAVALTVTVTDGSDTPVAVTGASFTLRVFISYEYTTEPTA